MTLKMLSLTIVIGLVTSAFAIPSAGQISSNFECPTEGGYHPHPVNCELYYGCNNYVPTLISCPRNQLFDLRYRGCNWPELTACQDRTRPEGSPSTVTPPPPEDLTTARTFPCPPDVADDTFPDENNCSAYYRCVYGNSYRYVCAPPLVYDVVKKQCDFRMNVDCGTRPIPS